MPGGPFSFMHHTEIQFGCGKIQEIGDIAKGIGARAFIVCDAGVVGAGITRKAEKLLSEAGIDYLVYDAVMPNPRDTCCEEAAALAGQFNPDMIIGIGGGSAMDTAKAVSVLIPNGGTCMEWAELGSFEKDVVPVICIPTTSGTGSEVTFEAVITMSETSTKMSMMDGARLAPKIAVMDPELTLTVPPVITASTGMDALTHALEAYTCSYANPITDGLALYAMKTIAENIVAATEDGSNLEARENMMIGSLMAGIAFTNSFLGAVHSLSERIGGYYDTPHGIANSIFLPYVTEFNLSSNYDKHAEVAQCLGVDIDNRTPEEASMLGVKRIFELNSILGIPRFADVKGVNPEDFEMIAEICVSHICTVGNPKEITKEDYLNILKIAYAQ